MTGSYSGSETRGQVSLAAMVPAYAETVRLWDSKYEGLSSWIMGDKSSNTLTFRWPIVPDTGYMASVGVETDPGIPFEGASYLESFWTRVYKTAWKNEPTMWDAELGPGKMGVQLEFKIQQAAKAMQRRIDYESLSYITGDVGIMSRYSNQDTGRMKQFVMTSSTAPTGMSAGLHGNSWGTITGTSNLPDILFDIDTIILNWKDVGDQPAKKFIIGPKTFYSMQRNKSLKDDIKYVHDIRQNIVGAEVKGLNIREVVYDRYKEASADWGNVIGGKGLGSTMWDKWTDMKSKRFMRYTETIDGTPKNFELAMITADKVGDIWKAPVFTSERYPKGDDVTHTYWEDDPLMLRSWRMIRRGYSVSDFADIAILKRIVEV